MEPIQFVLNGKPTQVAGIDPHVTLLEYLRGQNMTGTKEGCGEGECGACAVALVVKGQDGKLRYEVVNSCLVLLVEVAGKEVITVEGLGEPSALHPVQEAMAQGGASQCGYCTPGFVMSLFAEYYREGRGTGFDPEAISGNLCRCTGYRPIRDAGRCMATPAQGDPFLERLGGSLPPLPRVHVEHGGRRFYRPRALKDLFGLMKSEPEAKLIAGGTDVTVEITQRHARFPALISLEGLEELRVLERTPEFLEIGAGIPLRELEERLHGELPLFDELFPLFASRMIRSRATLGGNLVNASPIGDSAPVLLALDARVRLASAQGERVVPLSSFFVGYRKTALAPGEIMASVRVPRPFPEVSRFYKVSKRKLDDISTVAAAFALSFDRAGRISQARLAYGGVGPTPARATDAESCLVGMTWGEEAMRKARGALATAFQPISDHRGSANYRREMIVKLFEKFHAEHKGGTSCAS
ncbi:MAG: xanthine dehydrogenase small subunit [Deltaproteobacteria bacterium]|nr:xanthine dehydrogenase small subunit [Deltaproteobacteria bacterium]